MSVWHGNLQKKKRSGGRKRMYRIKRKFEQGTFAAETTIGEPKRSCSRGFGGNIKLKALKEKYASVTDTKSGKTQKTEILSVLKNPANVDYNRRGVITKGAEIETAMGVARVTSRPGNVGIINAVLVTGGKEGKA